MTPVHVAAAWGRTRILHLLLLNGGNPWLKDAYNKNAFHYAFQERNWDVVELLHKFHLMELSSKNQSWMEPNYKLLLERIIVSAGNLCIEYEVNDCQKVTKCATTQTSLEEDQQPKLPVESADSSQTKVPVGVISDKDSQHQIFSKSNYSHDLFSYKDDCDEHNSNVLGKLDRSTLLPCKRENSDLLYEDCIKLESEKNNSPSRNDDSFENIGYDVKSTDSCISHDSIESGILPLLDTSNSSGMYYNNNGIKKWLTHHLENCNNGSSVYYTCEEDNVGNEDDGSQVSENNAKTEVYHCVLSSDSGGNGMKSKQDNLNCGSQVLKEGNISTASNGSSTNTVLTVSEEYKYTDDEKGIVLLERRFKTTSVSISDFPELNPNFSAELSDSYDTDALREELKARGYAPGPITATTKRVYRRQLHFLPPVPVTNERVYSLELERTLKNSKMQSILTPCINLEKEVVTQFAEPDPKCRWREGLVKSSFNYLLLDPRITNNLPCRASELSVAQTWSTFLASIFYIGKGKRSRPYSHLYEAVATWNTNKSVNVNEKVRVIIDIWKAGLGVVCLHVFQNVIPAEAYTREAAMIEAIDLRNLCNIRRSEYYGKAATWNSRDKRLFGAYLLHRAMQIFLSEGERQLRPGDIG
ncbi:uncharacterized protein [Anabrus simplex]